MKYEVFAEYSDYAGKLSFYIFEIRADGQRALFESLSDEPVLRVIKDGVAIDTPTFTLRQWTAKPFMQEMANLLKRLGIHAEGEPVLENELTAVKYHLEDFRQLVFKGRVK